MKLSTVAAVISAAAFTLAAGVAFAGGTGAARTRAAAPPVAGKACTKVGAIGKTAGGVKLACTKQAKGKLVWVASKPATSTKPTKPAKPATSTTSTTPAKPATTTTTATTASGGNAGASPELIAKGKDFFLNGVGSQGIACARCHGANALGDTAPKIAGKNATQIKTAIQSVGVMAPFFSDVSDDQVNAIAAYLQSLGK